MTRPGFLSKKKAIMLVAFVLFSLASPLIKYLVLHGGEFGLTHPGAISFCNVLFVGNLCAALMLLVYFGPGRLAQGLGKTKKFLLLTLSVGLATAAPALLFTALRTTSVTNLVLLGRFEVVVYALIAASILKVELAKKQILGLSFIAIGTFSLALLSSNFELMKGDLQILLATVLFSVDTLLSKRLLRDMEPESLTFLRTAVSAVVFFFIAIKLFGMEHFMDAFEGELWEVMMVYSLVLVVVANLLYYYALPGCDLSFLTELALVSPVLTILFAFTLLGEVPDKFQIGAGIIILVGLAVSGRGSEERPRILENGFLGSRAEM